MEDQFSGRTALKKDLLQGNVQLSLVSCTNLKPSWRASAV